MRSYIPTVWANGDVITAEKLNKIEGGIESASGGGLPVIVFNKNDNTITYNGTVPLINLLNDIAYGTNMYDIYLIDMDTEGNGGLCKCVHALGDTGYDYLTLTFLHYQSLDSTYFLLTIGCQGEPVGPPGEYSWTISVDTNARISIASGD